MYFCTSRGRDPRVCDSRAERTRGDTYSGSAPGNRRSNLTSVTPLVFVADPGRNRAIRAMCTSNASAGGRTIGRPSSRAAHRRPCTQRCMGCICGSMFSLHPVGPVCKRASPRFTPARWYNCGTQPGAQITLGRRHGAPNALAISPCSYQGRLALPVRPPLASVSSICTLPEIRRF